MSNLSNVTELPPKPEEHLCTGCGAAVGLVKHGDLFCFKQSRVNCICCAEPVCMCRTDGVGQADRPVCDACDCARNDVVDYLEDPTYEMKEVE